MEEFNPMLKSRCVTGKSDFKGDFNQISVETVCIAERSLNLREQDLFEQVKSKTVRKPWDLFCVTVCTRLLKTAWCLPSLFPMLGRESAVRIEHRLFKEVPDWEVNKKSYEWHPFTSRHPLAVEYEASGCQNSRILSVHPKKDIAQTMAPHLPRVLPSSPHPAVTCMQW